MRIEFLIFKERHANAAYLSQFLVFATADLCCRFHRFHSCARQERNILVLHVIELLDRFHGIAKAVAIGAHAM